MQRAAERVTMVRRVGVVVMAALVVRKGSRCVLYDRAGPQGAFALAKLRRLARCHETRWASASNLTAGLINGGLEQDRGGEVR